MFLDSLWFWSFLKSRVFVLHLSPENLSSGWAVPPRWAGFALLAIWSKITQDISWITWRVLLWALHGRVVVLYIRDGAVQYFCSPGCNCWLLLRWCLISPIWEIPSWSRAGGGWILDLELLLLVGMLIELKNTEKKMFQLHSSPGAFPKMSACLFWPGLAPRISVMPSVTFSIRCISTVWWRSAEPSSAPWMEPSSTPSEWESRGRGSSAVHTAAQHPQVPFKGSAMSKWRPSGAVHLPDSEGVVGKEMLQILRQIC